MKKRDTIQGSPESKMIQLIRKIGHNQDMEMEVATVTSPFPNLTVRLGKDGIELDESDLIINEHLTTHTRYISIAELDTISESNLEIKKVSGKVSGGYNLQTLNVNKVPVTFHSNLAKGDFVQIISDKEKQMYFLVDKVVF